MKNQSKKEEYIKQFLIELGTEKPSNNFHKTILGRLNHSNSGLVYKPVISTFGWKILSFIVAALVIIVILFVPESSSTSSIYEQFPDLVFQTVTISIPKVFIPTINLSPIVIQSLVSFMILALLALINFHKKLKTI